MRKFYLLAVFALGLAFSAEAQFTDDIEAYSTGPLFTPRWTTWTGDNDGAQNAIVSTDQALSGSQSIFIGPSSGGQDAILDFQGAAPNGSGVWTSLWWMYVPTGNSAYFNVQGNVTPSANDNLQFLSGDIYLNEANGNPGGGTDSNGGGTFSFPHDAWFTVKIVVDTDAETYQLTVDGNEVPEVGYSNASDGFAGIDFFAAEGVTTYYVDDVQLAEGELGADSFASNVFSVYPNPVKDFLTIESSEVVDNVVVYDVLGKAVLQASPDRISPKIDMSGLSSGAYMVKVTIGNASKTIKVLK
ncbi:T9SS type A sorting domain-containing protein [Luteirhabdus pelagi]|uniref:T9SS type A sorting domain-containing protein n=1 Tax=Luteirhabdus pelagi TaxID=2792783 RepID=UPI00193AB3DF|nr:T9SS type A sorting domain-containing protein [Luteirhabdus pelagi]